MLLPLLLLLLGCLVFHLVPSSPYSLLAIPARIAYILYTDEEIPANWPLESRIF